MPNGFSGWTVASVCTVPAVSSVSALPSGCAFSAVSAVSAQLRLLRAGAMRMPEVQRSGRSSADARAGASACAAHRADAVFIFVQFFFLVSVLLCVTLYAPRVFVHISYHTDAFFAVDHHRRPSVLFSQGNNNPAGGGDGGNVAAGDGQASSFLTFNEDGPERWGDAHRVARMEEVEVHRLDGVISAITAERPDARIYLKLDTQGLDLAILRSAGDSIRRILGLQAEIAAHQFYEGMVRFGDAINGFHELGFEITGVFPLSREFDNLRVIEFDFVFMRNDR